MLRTAIVTTVERCVRFPVLTIAVFLLLAGATGYYAAKHFAINTDISKLISPDLDWRQREIDLDATFPGSLGSIVAVVDAPTPELATAAATALESRLKARPELFPAVELAGGGEFFARNAFLFLPAPEVERIVAGLSEASPLLALLSEEQSLVGLSKALRTTLNGLQNGRVKLDDLVRTFALAADTAEAALAGRPAYFSWRSLAAGKNPEASELRRLVQVQPKLDFTALEPGRAASDAIRAEVAALRLTDLYGARVRLTGPVPIADEEFGTLQEGALVNAVATLLIVFTILWLALRSGRIILAVFVNLLVGLVLTAAAGLALVGALNLISIAFAVLFVGLGVDFGIQYAVRYRAERHASGELQAGLINSAAAIGAPLTLAAGSVAAGFLSFLPTAYKGVSELGQIAGVGMLIAFATSVTLLPALLKLLNPPGEPDDVGYAALAPVDRFLERHRVPVVAGTALVALAGAPLLYFLTFDFNPLNLRSPHVESVSTYLELRRDLNLGANAVTVLAPSLDEAAAAADRLAKLPEVARTMTLRSFVPDEQDRKLTAIRELADALGDAPAAEPPPADSQTVEALKTTAAALDSAAAGQTGAGADAARRLGRALNGLAAAAPDVRAKTETAFILPLRVALGDIRSATQAQPVTVETLPASLKRAWVAPDGRARAEVNPNGDPDDNENARRFANAVLKAAPTAIGGPISILESGDTIVRAFLHAGFWALLSIAILLWIVLKRLGDVLLTLIPLLVAGALTLEFCVLIGMPLNFANIIALPLLLGVGVAFKIYYIMAWRGGQTALLQSSLTRAVFWSALTTATAFGSLWLSSHPGTSSMGKLMALSLVTTLAAAVLFQPALMGKPRSRARDA